MTQLIKARQGIITPEVERLAKVEGLRAEELCEKVAQGRAVILKNKQRKNSVSIAIGEGLRTKVNANIGTSPDCVDFSDELHKIKVAVAAGADSIMELSIGGDVDAFHRQVLDTFTLPVGSVPTYQTGMESIAKHGSVVGMTAEDMFEMIERQAERGIDFMAIHAALNMSIVERLKNQGRITDIVSRGGAFLTGWMFHHEQENPLYTQFDRVLEICKKYDVTLSVGDAIRPGCIEDSLDRAQVQGLIVAGELVQRALAAGVQVMVEGPGHVPVDQIPATILLQKQLCHHVPYYILGNLVTDIAPGYDHITGAIGATAAAMAGANFICYVTPAEHLRLPTAEDVHAGVIATRIATHAADIVNGVKGAREWDLAMAHARKALDWNKQIELSIDPPTAQRIRGERNEEGAEACSMCGGFCAMKLVGEHLGKTGGTC
ncbi:B12 lower ligand biosynthesis ThiC-like protein BzaB [Desulfosporosinus sp.]|uniref:B12 lower ligand biosynthesis ThiC-like protein BzaB n=1 Tax=Desulfosporosinus sp. TaxID=157907 RepID=UPI00231ED4CD|nr:B12 lower ligand biosynthesis ThiC-like protein BzaB [Desulfosporosinus sp.]MDA8220185.1 B12 lower ligand biosynthesis ThiC-like protein BzaB [Desulfitobacterium hafniense]